MKRLTIFLGLFVVYGFAFVNNVNATLTLKINNKIQSELTTEIGCVGTDLYFIGSVQNNPPAIGYTFPTPKWTGSGAAYINDVNSNVITFNCPTPGDYQITYSAIKSGITYTITQNIKIVSKDILTLVSPSSTPYNVCQETSVTLQASGTTYYYWEREKDAVVEGIGTTATLSETPPTYGTWTYRIYGGNDGCPSDPSVIEFQIVVDQAPTVNAGGPYETCSEVGIALNGSTGGSATSAQWIGGAGTFTPDRNSLTATYKPHASESGTDVTLILRSNDPPGVCGYVESSATITVHSLPTVTLSAFTPVCIDVPAFALTGGSPAGGTYSGPSVVGGNFDPTSAGAGTHTITYTYTDANGCINSATNTIKVNALPVVTFGGTLTAQCLTSTAYTLTGGSPAGGTYGGTGVTGTNFNASVAGVGNHTITYTYTDANGCTNSATNTITVNALPVVTLGAFADVCVNAPAFALTGGNPAGGTYSGNGVIGGNFTPLTAGVGTHTITYTFTDANGCTNSATNTIKVNDKPTVTLSAFSQVCIDAAPFALTGGSPAGGTYSGSGVSGGIFNPATAGAGTHTITYTYTDGFSCSNSATNTIKVNALPTVTFGGTLTAQCLTSTSYTLTGGNPAGGTYSGPGVTGTNFNASVAGVGNHTITYTYTDANGCTNSATNTITVNALPVVTLGAFADVCVNAPAFALTGGNPAGGTYSGNGVIGGNFTPLTAGVGTHMITYTFTDANGCTNSATNTIKVNDKPMVTLSAFTPVCIDVPAFALTGGSPAGGTYSGPSVVGGNFDPTSAGAGTHTITYTYTDGFSCSNSATNTITVNALPVVTFGGTLTAQCLTSTAYTLTGGSPAGGTYSGTGVTGTNFNASVAGVGNHTITYTYTDANGCTNSATNTITVNALPVVTFGGSLTAQCLTSTTYTLTGGNPAGGTYSGPGVTGTNFNASVAGAGTHTITYTYTNPATGCSNSATNTITVYSLPTVTFTGTLATQCISSTTYTITGGNPAGGVYSGPGVTGTNFNASVAGAGTHTITYTYTDGNGCSNSATNTITVNSAISNNTISTTKLSICYNSIPAQLDGTIPSGGNGAYTYQWQSKTALTSYTDITGATSQNYIPAAPLTENTWYRRIVTSLPCSDNTSNELQITVGGVFTVSFTTTSPLCVGAPSGTATANPSGGISPYTYSWNTVPVQTTQKAINLAAGTYTVTVTDNIGCFITGDATVSDPTPITLGVPTVTPISGCFGDNTGSIQILASGGTAPYTYSLYNNSVLVTTQTKATGIPADFTGLGAGTLYEVRVTDVNSCDPVSSGNIIVTGPSQIIISDIATTPISCSGSTDGTITITASGGTGALEYSIDGGGTYQPGKVFNVGEGYYDIVVRDANGCTATWPVQIIMDEPSEISFNYEITNITTCNGDHTGKIVISNVSGGSGTGYEYSIYLPEVWGTNPVFENLPGGTANQYYIKVRDSHGCIKVGNNGNPITINEPTPITFNVVTTNVTTCWYNENATIKVNSVLGGTGSKTVSIDGITYYPTTKVFFVGIGDKIVYVKDSKGCIAQKPVSITGPTPIVINTLTTKDLTCNGAVPPDGEIHATASGGTGTLRYSIDGLTYQPTGDFTAIPAGDYTLIVKDDNDCELKTPIKINEPTPLVFTIQEKTDITCNGLNNGTIKLAATGGYSPYIYTITGVPPTAKTPDPYTFTGLSSGVYTATVLDDKGCSKTGNTFTIINPAPLTITSAVPTDISCFGQVDGKIDIAVSGGTPPYTYTLYNAGVLVKTDVSTSPYTFTGLGAGNYTVSVDDAHTCGAVPSGVLAIAEPTAVDLAFLKSDLNCHGDNSGEILLTASGGTPPYQYSIDGGVTFDVNDYYTGLAGGDYNVVARDSRGCEKSLTVTLVEPAAMTLNLQGYNISCAGVAPDGRIVATVVGGTAPFNYRIDGGAWHASGTFNNVGALPNPHVVEVLDNKGCMASNTVVISEPLPITISPDPPVSTNPTCTTPGSITVAATGGTGTLTYTLNPSGVTNTDGIFTNLGAGTYTVSVTDENSCGPVVSAPVTLVSPSTVNIVSIDVVDVTPCFGGNNGSITINATGGTGLKYSIDGGATYLPTNTFTGLTAGTYNIAVNDDNDCPQTDVRTINQPAEIVITDVTVTQITGLGATDGQISITATGGTGNLTYTLNSTGTTLTLAPGVAAVFPGLGAGTYTVDVTDEKGCTKPTGDIFIGLIDLDLTVTEITCNGANNGRIDLTINGGVAPFTITWEGPLGPLPAFDGLYSITGLTAGTYTVHVVDGAGSIGIKDTIIQPEPAVLTAALVETDLPICYDKVAGHVDFNIAGGTPSYTIAWESGSQSGVTSVDPGPGIHNFTITDSRGCSVAINNIRLTEPILFTGNIVSPGTCPYVADKGVELNVTSTGSYTYLWSNGQTTRNLTNVASGDYSVTVTDIDGCSLSDSYTITPYMLSITDVSITGAKCYGYKEGDRDIGSIKILSVFGGVGNSANFKYVWDYPKTGDPAKGDFIDKIPGGTYTVTVTDEGGCEYKQSFDVPSDPAYHLGVTIEKDTSICHGNSVKLKAVTDGIASSYKWYKAPETSKVIGTGSELTVSPTEDAQYLVEVRNDGECLNLDFANVSVFPQIGLYIPPYVSAVRDTIISILSGTTYNIDVNAQNTEYPTTFKWEPSVLFTPSDTWNSSMLYSDDASAQIPEYRKVQLVDPVTKRKVSYVIVDVKATSSKGCVDSLRLYTRLVDKLSFGNVFSPNGDGKNDVWRVPKDYLFPDLEIEVYNRWGALVWSAKGETAARGWDGKTNSGNDLPIGTYYYVIKYNVNTTSGNWKPITGSITIVR